MSVNDRALIQKLQADHQDGVLSREFIEVIAKLGGKQYFVEEVEKSPADLFVFSVLIEISAFEDYCSEEEIAEYFSSVPPESKFRAVYLGGIKAYYPTHTDSIFPSTIGLSRQLSLGWQGALFMAFNGSLWIFSEGVVYLAAHSFEEFILLSPKTHFERVYLLRF